MKQIALIAVAATLSGCVEYNVIGATPEGGTIAAIGNENLMLYEKGLVQRDMAEKLCARYGKRAVFPGATSGPLVDYKCE